MKEFYNVTQKIKTALEAEPFINTVTFGDIFEIDLDKQTIYPLAHMIVNNASIAEETITLNMSVILMDIVDASKSETTDKFIGNNNEQDVLNTQLAVASRLVNLLKRGSLYTDLFQVVADVSCEPFTDRFENAVAGWTLSMDIIVANDMTVC